VKLCASGQDASGVQRLYHTEVAKVLDDAFQQMSDLLIAKVCGKCVEFVFLVIWFIRRYTMQFFMIQRNTTKQLYQNTYISILLLDM